MEDDCQSTEKFPELDKGDWKKLCALCTLLLVGVCIFANSQHKEINDLRKQNASQQREIKDLQSIIEKVDEAVRARSLQYSLLRKMCREMEGYENLPGGKWSLYSPYELMPGGDDIAICLQGNELRNAIPPIVPAN